MSNRAKIAVVLGVIIAGLLVLFYLFNGEAPGTPPASMPAPVGTRIATAPTITGPLLPVTPTPPSAKTQIAPPSLTPAQVAAFRQPLAAAGLNSLPPITPATPEAIKAIQNNLRQLGNAAQSYMLDNSSATGASYDDLTGTDTENYLHPLDSVIGEDYTGITIKNGQSQVTISTPDGTIITYSL